MDYNHSIVRTVCAILQDDGNRTKWEDSYARYAAILSSQKQKTRYLDARSKFRLPKPFSAYTTITAAMRSPEFDIRVFGQSVGTIKVCRGEVLLNVEPKKAKKNSEYFHIDYYPVHRKKWDSKEACQFRKLFKDLKIGKLKSEEHKVENYSLDEFSKRLRKENKALCNIQPVRLFDCYYQFTTPIKASTHNPSFSMREDGAATGGGIDILARTRHADNRIRLAIIELKDENNPREPQKDVLIQALSYATFVAHLLRSRSSDMWWKVFGFSGISHEPLVLDVVTLMPKGDSEEGVQAPIFIEELNVTLQPSTLYYSLNENGDIVSFEGTLVDYLPK